MESESYRGMLVDSELSHIQKIEIQTAVDKVVKEYGEVLIMLGGGRMHKPLFIYLVHPMSGLKWEEVERYYTKAKTELDAAGYYTMHPMCAKSELKNNKFDPKAAESHSPVVSPHAITRRDHWMVRKADVVFADLSGAKEKSIGCISEVSAAYELGKHTIGVMEKGNCHEHAFMFEQFDIVFRTYDEAAEYLKKLIRGEY